jgi:hypothetical protein
LFGKVLGLTLFMVLLLGFNTFAVLIVMGKNPIMAVGYNFRAGKWEVSRHKENLGSKIFGYLFAGIVFFMDFWMVVGLFRGILE